MPKENKLPVSNSAVDYGDQDENGVDLSLIRSNLRLSPLERVRRAERRSKELLQLREHVRRSCEKRT